MSGRKRNAEERQTHRRRISQKLQSADVEDHGTGGTQALNNPCVSTERSGFQRVEINSTISLRREPRSVLKHTNQIGAEVGTLRTDQLDDVGMPVGKDKVRAARAERAEHMCRRSL